MEKILTLENIINKGKYKGKTVREIINIDRKHILELYASGYDFVDEVFECARYKRLGKSSHTYNTEVITHNSINIKKYSKDTEDINKIIEKMSYFNNDSVEEEVEDTTFEYDD